MILVSESLSKPQDFKTMGEKRQNRKLKLIRRELKKWIKQMAAEEKLCEQACKYNAEQLKIQNEAYIAHCNADQ